MSMWKQYPKAKLRFIDYDMHLVSPINFDGQASE